MDLNNATMLSTPQKLPGDPEELAMIENLENELNTLADCLEKSNDKGKNSNFSHALVRVQMRKIQEQTEIVNSLSLENKTLSEENAKLRNLIDKHMKNFSCFTTEINKNLALEAENASLHTRLNNLTTVN
jgi:Zn-dependent M32 family carboxypeptidase